MGQGTECGDRPTEVSVIRFVSRNRTIEEIAPKKEIYTCKQKGCGKIFTNHDEFKTHEALEELKIRFICREPGCGKELSDPGSMWRHYQECHNNETNVFICPYTSCGSLHNTSEILEEHIESCHRQPPTFATEPEIICFEGPGSTCLDEEGNPRNEDDADEEDENQDNDKKMIQFHNLSNDLKKNDFLINKNFSSTSDTYSSSKNERLTSENNDGKNIENEMTDEFFNNKFDLKNEESICTSGEYKVEKNEKVQEHRIDLGNLEKVFRSGFEGESMKIESNNVEISAIASDDEEYTPKKQRMSRCNKQEPYKCEINGCGKMYKYISHYRHHQDSHKIQIQENKETKSTKVNKAKQNKASTVSFFLCKIPGCGAQVDNVTSLWKHYQDNHANSKAIMQSPKNNQLFRCKITNCDMEFRTSVQLYKHFNDAHTNTKNSSITCSLLESTNGKTEDDSNIQFVDEILQNNMTTRGTLKTDIKANCNINIDNYNESNENRSLLSMTIVKEESHD
ncbi:uncharacterized protein [Chelonus insularis]|uniref:uncharacterized protein n=1 Tax=Chelonus insularis TaxID=460826 RepID=UPI00158B978A|nr:uncharacterized protein LOC118072880 [Chelonus insularis]